MNHIRFSLFVPIRLFSPLIVTTVREWDRLVKECFLELFLGFKLREGKIIGQTTGEIFKNFSK
jgi:hypothetical protein